MESSSAQASLIIRQHDCVLQGNGVRPTITSFGHELLWRYILAAVSPWLLVDLLMAAMWGHVGDKGVRWVAVSTFPLWSVLFAAILSPVGNGHSLRYMPSAYPSLLPLLVLVLTCQHTQLTAFVVALYALVCNPGLGESPQFRSADTQSAVFNVMPGILGSPAWKISRDNLLRRFREESFSRQLLPLVWKHAGPVRYHVLKTLVGFAVVAALSGRLLDIFDGVQWEARVAVTVVVWMVHGMWGRGEILISYSAFEARLLAASGFISISSDLYGWARNATTFVAVSASAAVVVFAYRLVSWVALPQIVVPLAVAGVALLAASLQKRPVTIHFWPNIFVNTSPAVYTDRRVIYRLKVFHLLAKRVLMRSLLLVVVAWFFMPPGLIREMLLLILILIATLTVLLGVVSTMDINAQPLGLLRGIYIVGAALFAWFGAETLVVHASSVLSSRAIAIIAFCVPFALASCFLKWVIQLPKSRR